MPGELLVRWSHNVVKTKPEHQGSAASRVAFILARILVGVFGLLLCVLGCVFIWIAFNGETQWWCLALGLAFEMGGLWFLWSALKPHRENVADICTSVVARVLEEVF
jgi:hypothetical protein